MEKEIFYLTFGQNSPAKNGWIEIRAIDYQAAIDMAFKTYDRQWSMLYTSDNFEKQSFPAGCLGVLK